MHIFPLMEVITLNNDISVFFITAKSFPNGIAEAHGTLTKLVPSSKERKFFGISRPEGSEGIVYRAAAEEASPGEGEKLNCDTLVLKKGRYISLIVNDYTRDTQAIERAFKKLLEYPGIDPQGYCVEWYLPAGTPPLEAKNARCMVRLEHN